MTGLARCACGDFVRGTDTVCAACQGTDRYINQTQTKENHPVNLVDFLYRLARTANTVRAASRGPAALGRLLVRRQVYRAEGRATRKTMRRMGL